MKKSYKKPLLFK